MAKREAAVCVNLIATRCRVAYGASLERLTKPPQEKLLLRLDQRSPLVKAGWHHPFNAIVRYLAQRTRAAPPRSAPVSSGLSSVNNEKARTKAAMIRVT